MSITIYAANAAEAVELRRDDQAAGPENRLLPRQSPRRPNMIADRHAQLTTSVERQPNGVEELGAVGFTNGRTLVPTR